MKLWRKKTPVSITPEFEMGIKDPSGRWVLGPVTIEHLYYMAKYSGTDVKYGWPRGQSIMGHAMSAGGWTLQVMMLAPPKPDGSPHNHYSLPL